MRELKNLLEKMELAVRRYRLICAGDAILIGVSGGADSTALLSLLSKVQKKYSLKIAAAHLNHGLFPKQASEHEDFVRALSKKFKIKFHLKKVDVKKMAQASKRSLEETGRMARYDFFQKIAKQHRFNKIATAHTLDDQAETVLMRILRGTGLRGLAGIPYKRDTESGIPVIRPLLDIPKKELFSFLKKTGQRYCRDASNESVDFTRNKLRKNFMPGLERAFNPKLKESLASLSRVADACRRHLEKEAARALKEALISQGARTTKLRISNLSKLPNAVSSELLLQAAERSLGRRINLGFNHVLAIMDILRTEENTLELTLPGGLKVLKKRGVLEFIDTFSK